jgi:acyl-CoA thioester hydrolase
MTRIMSEERAVAHNTPGKMKMTDSVFTWGARVRVYECDALGHVNNAVYLHYLQQATAEAWARHGASAWGLRSLATEYLAPAYSGDDLEVQAWSDGVDGALLACGYNITRPENARTIVRARATWVSPSADAGTPPPPDWPAAPAGLARIAPLRLPPDRLNAHRYRWAHTVCAYELDGSGCVNPVQLLRWVEEAKFVACTEVGWPLERMFATDLMIVQIRHDSEFYAPLRARERVQVFSRICDLRLLKGTWRHEVYRLHPASDGGADEKELIALDYSTGAFLNCAGKPNPAPKAFLDALLQGDHRPQTIIGPSSS